VIRAYSSECRLDLIVSDSFIFSMERGLGIFGGSLGVQPRFLVHASCERANPVLFDVCGFQTIKLPKNVPSLVGMLCQGLSRKKKIRQSMNPMLLMQIVAPNRRDHSGCCAYISMYIVQW
jgi:hypothetical protein